MLQLSQGVGVVKSLGVAGLIEGQGDVSLRSQPAFKLAATGFQMVGKTGLELAAQQAKRRLDL